jgi:glycosyltransferase involved in cell wall biosynthesis
MRILFCGTHPNVATGYANVVYHLLGELKKRHEIVLFAFDAQAASLDRAESMRIKIISPYRVNQQRFGESLLEQTLINEKPDLVFLYNDILVVSALLRRIGHLSIPKWVYLDMVYEWQDHRLIKEILDRSDRIFVFTPFWQKHLREMFPDMNLRTDVLYHGLKPQSKFSDSEIEQLRRKVLPGADDGTFVVLNLNRNTLRKRWDLTLRAFLIFLKRNGLPPEARLFAGCQAKETLDLEEVLWVECQRLKLDYQQALRRIWWKEEILSDREIDFLYRYCQVGLNTSNGEGFGLCSFEHASYGHPQIVGYVGGLTDCLVGARFVHPINDGHVFYEDTKGVIYDYRAEDFATAIDFYYHHPQQRELDGAALQRFVTSQVFDWTRIAEQLSNQVEELPGGRP